MNKRLGILIALATLAAAPSLAFAKDSLPDGSPKSSLSEKSTPSDPTASTASEFAPDGLAKEVMDLMAGVSRPIDGSTNVIVQAGKGFRIGLTF